jgi:hypothetical protein
MVVLSDMAQGAAALSRLYVLVDTDTLHSPPTWLIFCMACGV